MTEGRFHFIRKEYTSLTPEERIMVDARSEDKRKKRSAKRIDNQLEDGEVKKEDLDALIEKYYPGQTTSLNHLETDDDGNVVWELGLHDDKKPIKDGKPKYKVSFLGTVDEILDQLEDYLEKGKWIG
ncbi:MAG: hypothetical protein AAB673_03665, partial [Patescibacteria group bacterium]